MLKPSLNLKLAGSVTTRVNDDATLSYLRSSTKRTFLAIIGKLLTQSNQHSVQPPQHIWRIVDLGLEDCDTRHQDSSSLLVKGRGDRWMTTLGKRPGNGRDSQAILTRSVLVMGDELNESVRARLQRLTSGRHHLEIDSQRRFWRKRADLPG